ncbi:lantibiotic dehydratase family protein [Desmonostoc muscorum LEGE 12446]|uniref:Lantibiotic dehydratase n=1 Tax=Desmonostoc muscorum LEGE 12446 TaxID=1828758 RepID=A0A8J6ZQV1_DESMC|nr:lantibiotic dehydratase [Desmonostoc muscorum]MCF2151399.1 lantibiotic dehydratase family protein [Desmonostoc muscorum LEGE 12446]
MCNQLQKPKIAPHEIELPGSNWTLWRSVCVRGAGFPANLLLSLEMSNCHIFAEEVLRLREEIAQARLIAIQNLDVEYKNLDKTERRPLAKALKKLRQHQLPDLDHPAVNQFRKVWLQMIAAQTTLSESLASGFLQNCHQLQILFSDSQFQEALLWQNREFADHIQTFLKQQCTTLNQSLWYKIRGLFNYLQRYCTKNDSIGFFGPIGWGTVTSQETAIKFTPGSDLLADRRVYLESWAINTLAQTLNVNNNLRPWLAPALVPNVYLAGNQLHLPAIAALIRDGKLPASVQSVIHLSQEQVELLQLCDGKQTAVTIAHQVMQNSTLHFSDEAAVYAQLQKLCQLGALRWTLEVPISQYPEKLLREKLNQIGDNTLRKSALTALSELETAKDQVIQAAGNTQRLSQALADLEATFTKLTNQAATRAAGKTYAGRTIIYEDCRRDIQLTLGTDLLAELGNPLDLLLTSTRWYTYQIAEGYQALFKQIYDELKQNCGNTEVDFYSFSLKALPLLRDENSSPIASARANLQKFWNEILAVSPDQKQVDYQAADLKSTVENTFTAPHAGWQLARYRSPDVMIAGSSVNAINQGEYQLVLGELHLFNTLSRAVFVSSHPNPTELMAARAQDITTPTIAPLPSPNWNTQRLALELVPPQDIRFAYEAGHPGIPDTKTVTLGELVVVETSEGLQIQTRDQRICFPIVEFFGYTLSNLCMSFPAILPPASHTPRVTIDRLVVVRESWRLPLADLAFAHTLDRTEQYLAIRQMVKDYELPRFVFARVPSEVKPYYIDFNSPVYCELLAKIARQAVTANPEYYLCLTEMLPSFDQLWLTDAAGQRYTSELRLVALDPKSPPFHICVM